MDLALYSTVSENDVYVSVSGKFKDIAKKNPPKNILRWMKLIESQAPVAKALKELPSEVLDSLSKASSRFIYRVFILYLLFVPMGK